MGSDVGQIFPTASLHRDHSISYALVCEKEISHMGKNNGNPDFVWKKFYYSFITVCFALVIVLTWFPGNSTELAVAVLIGHKYVF